MQYLVAQLREDIKESVFLRFLLQRMKKTRIGLGNINIVTKDRQVDELLKKRIGSGRIYICERHFTPEQFYVCKY